ncbi:MAG TPA: hypothetical protein VFV50_01525 [Bdellovibrionales bacterium]|nr:hypothetical protein [Bdellovibrionales bacterium]
MFSRILMILAVAFTLQLATSGTAQAGDVVCHNNDCLRFGWTYRTFQGYTVVRCNMNDCMNVGYTATDNFGRTTSGACKAGGCYVSGWVETQHFFPYQGFETICKGNQCMGLGWSTYQYGRMVADVTCTNLSCLAFGWNMTVFPNAYTNVQCKAGACFTFGWVTYP